MKKLISVVQGDFIIEQVEIKDDIEEAILELDFGLRNLGMLDDNTEIVVTEEMPE